MITKPTLNRLQSIKAAHKKALKDVLQSGDSGRVLVYRLRQITDIPFEVAAKAGISTSEAYYVAAYGGANPKCVCGKTLKFYTATSGYLKFCGRRCAAQEKRRSPRQSMNPHPDFLNHLPYKPKLASFLNGNASTIRIRVKTNMPNTFERISALSAKYEIPAAQIMYHMATGLKVPVCKSEGCTSHTRFYSASRGYKNFCPSSACRANDPDMMKKMREGYDNRDVEAQRRRARKKFGCDHHTQAKSVKEKRVRTCLKKYGVRHQLQNSDVFKRVQDSGFKHRKIERDGLEFVVSGYEHHALDLLLRTVKASRIYTLGHEKYRTFRYRGGRVYYPDLIVGKKIIEVKSTFTCCKNLKVWRNIRAKAKGVITEGFKHEIWVLNKKGVMLAKVDGSMRYSQVCKMLGTKPKRQ